MVDELDDDLAHLNDLDSTGGFDLSVFLQERRQQASAAGDTGDGKAEIIGSSQGGTVNASLAPAGRAKARRSVRLKGARWTLPRPREGGSKARRSVRLKREVDASSVPAGRAESDLSAASTSGTDEGYGEDPPRGPVGEGSARAERHGMSPRDSAGPDPGSEPTPGCRTAC